MCCNNYLFLLSSPFETEENGTHQGSITYSKEVA